MYNRPAPPPLPPKKKVIGTFFHKQTTKKRKEKRETDTEKKKVQDETSVESVAFSGQSDNCGVQDEKKDSKSIKKMAEKKSTGEIT